MFYSHSTGGFYKSSIHGNSIPSDAVSITDDIHKELLEGQSAGLVISSGADGFPVLVEREVLIQKVESVTRAQGKAALVIAGLLQGVLGYIDSIVDPVEKAIAEVALNDTTHWQRSSPFLNSAAEALGLTDEQLDQLFIDASKIEL